MRAGRLRHRVALASPPSWTTVGTFWASVEPKLDAADDAPQSLRQGTPVVIRMRHQSGVSLYPGLRAVFGSRLYDVISFENTSEGNRQVLLNCREYIGEAGTYTPDGGAPESVTARIFSQVDYGGGITQTAERETIVALLKSQLSQAPVDGDTIAIRGSTYTIVGLTDDGDDDIEYKCRVLES